MNLRIPAFLCLAACAWGQDAGTTKLTLQQAVALALKQNPQVILANLAVERTEEDSRLAYSSLLPAVNGTLGQTTNRVNLHTAIGVKFPGFPQHVGPFYVYQGGVGFRAPLFDLTLWRRYRASQVGIEGSRAQEVTAREESVLLVVSQYLGSQRAAADVAAAQSRVELAQALYDQAADLQKNGVGTGIDTLRANVQLQNEKQRLIVASTQLETSLFGLSRLLSLDPAQKIELADQMKFFDTTAEPPRQAIERAWAARSELRQVSAARRRAEIALRSAGDERYPKVVLNGGWLQQGLTPTSAIPVYQYQFSMEVPLFTGGRIQAQRAEADIAIRELDQRARDARDAIALEVKTALARLDSARGEVTVANLGVDLAGQEVEQARDRFQAGVANNIEVISAQDALSRASDNQIAALYRFNQARADLAHSVGQMEALYGK